MIGVIIPRDPVANQAATVLTGNPLLQCVIEHSQADIKQMLHHLTTLLRFVPIVSSFQTAYLWTLTLKEHGFQVDPTGIRRYRAVARWGCCKAPSE